MQKRVILKGFAGLAPSPARLEGHAARYNRVMPRVKRYSTLSDEERAEKRAQALKLLEAGATGAIVARQLGVTKAAVSFWKRVQSRKKGARRSTARCDPAGSTRFARARLMC